MFQAGGIGFLVPVTTDSIVHTILFCHVYVVPCLIDEEGGRRRREAVECSSQGNNRFGSFGQEGSKLKQGTSVHASQCFGEKLQYMSLLLLLFNSALLHAIFFNTAHVL